MNGSPVVQEIGNPIREDLLHHRPQSGRRFHPQLSPPILSHPPTGFKKISGEEGEAQAVEPLRTKGVEAYSMKEGFIGDTLFIESPGRSRSVEDLPGKIPELLLQPGSKGLRILIPQGIVKKPGGYPPLEIHGSLPPGPGPTLHQLGHPGHMGSSLGSCHCPGRQDTFGGFPDDGMQERVVTRGRERQRDQPSIVWLSMRRVWPQYAATATTDPVSILSRESRVRGWTISPY